MAVNKSRCATREKNGRCCPQITARLVFNVFNIIFCDRDDNIIIVRAATSLVSTTTAADVVTDCGLNF